MSGEKGQFILFGQWLWKSCVEFHLVFGLGVYLISLDL